MKKSEALKILGLSEGYTDEDIKKAHRQKIRENHPDQFADPQKKSEAEEQTKLINEARDVLVNRKWDPEYGPRTGAGYNPYGSPYGGPYSYRPENPFGGQGQGFPFDFVWTTWDGSASGGTGQGSNPFDPFSSVFTQEPEKTAQEELDDAKGNLKRMLAFMGVKLLVLALCVATGAIPVGVTIYAVATVVYGLLFQARGCARMVAIGGVVFLLPILLRMLSLVLVASLSPLAIVLAIVAVAYDISILRSMISAYRTAKEKVKVAK